MTFNFLKDLTLKTKIISLILLITIGSLLIGFTVLFAFEVTEFKQNLKSNIHNLAKFISAKNISLLKFKEFAYTDNAFVSIENVEEISNAAIYDEKNEIFAKYSREKDFLFPVIRSNRLLEQEKDGYYIIQLPIVEDNIYYGKTYIRASLQPLNEKIRNNIFRLSIIIIIIVIIAIILTYRLQKYVTEPIINLSEIAEKVYKESNYNIQLKKVSNDEIGQLYDCINSLLTNINSYTKELKKVNQNLSQEVIEKENLVDELTQKSKDLEQTTRILERSNKELDQFAYAASHDLKAPLRAISNLTEWIEEDIQVGVNEETFDNLNLLKKRVQRMEQLIEGILQYSRADRFYYKSEDVDLNELIGEIGNSLNPDAKTEIIIKNKLPIINTEKIKIYQVFSNLISNAIKYNPDENKKIWIAAEIIDGKYRFSVKDNGPGIDESYHDKVFMIFQTLESKDKTDGTGIGLSLVKKLVEDNDGKIWISSKYKHGAEFVFTWSNEN